MFDRHKKSICSKRRFKKLSVLIRRLCIWLNFFLLSNGILLDLKTKRIVCYFFMLCYAIYKLIK